jgi:UDP:flavonoid glycosyltransferase YjiC (YdhE family)
MESTRKVVFFVAEAVTLAHYGRIATLSRALPASDYHVIVAADPRYRGLDEILGTDFYPIWSVSSDQFARSLKRGNSLYDAKTLVRYVEDDLALIDKIKPDLIVGDFRLSLAISAPLRKIPYASVVNAYWSPYAKVSYPVPDLPFTRLTGLGLGQWLFDLVRPLAFRLHARPLQKARRHFGLPPLPGDLRNAYTWGDYTLYADIPELFPMSTLSATHRHLGPVFWSSHNPLPDWWDKLPSNKPVVFVTLGSSGNAGLLPEIFKVLSRMPVTVIAATAGKVFSPDSSPNIHIVDYLPVEAAMKRAAIVVCNGGSLTTYQALASGIPVIGICSNMDQLLNMQALENLGAGFCMRAAQLSAAKFSDVVYRMLDQASFSTAAENSRQLLAQYDAMARMKNITAEILG